MPLTTGATIYRPPSSAAADQYAGYVSEDQALQAALAGCPDGLPAVVRDPPGQPPGYYPACAATGVFYSSLRAGAEDVLELVLDSWLPELWPGGG